MTVPDGGYLPHWQVVSSLVGRLSPTEEAAVLAGTARRVYHLQTRPEA